MRALTFVPVWAWSEVEERASRVLKALGEVPEGVELAVCTLADPGVELRPPRNVKKVYVGRTDNIRDPFIATEYLSDVVKGWKAEVILLDDSRISVWIAGLLGAKLGRNVYTEVVRILYDDGLIVGRPAYDETVILKFRIEEMPVVLCIRGSAFSGQERYGGEGAEVVEEQVNLAPKMKIVELGEARVRDLKKAEVVVGIGSGVSNRDFIKVVEELAKLMDAEVGVTRPLIDEGWFPKEFQIGFTGVRISPRLYLAIGISGAPYHIVGIKDSKRIVVINKDQTAPIFKHCDFGLVDDLYTAVPKLVEELKRLKG